MAYAIRLPDGTLVQNIPDEVTPQEAKRRILAAGLYKPPTPETTVLGEAKELFKGLVPGAVGLIESAATGASALLPEQTEKAAREKIASIAGAAKAPFAAAPGYEEAVGRKLGEAIGSTAPFLAAGPLGLAGKVGAVGLGVGAGAGEARTRAEKEGATAEQRSTATALGVIPGAMEVFAPFRILSRIPESAKAQGVQLVKRALVAGGEEAAQEAASGFAQNLIAKGVYKPEQELIEGLGEQAAYGGATGAIVQGLMDLALGRRARAARTAPEESPIERAEREATAKAAAPAPPAPPVEEPTVRKEGEPPATGLQPDEITGLGVTKKQPIFRRMLGKDMADPAQRDAVLADIEKYLTRGNGSEESRAKLTEFKERFATPAVETAPPAAEAATPAPTETPSATGTVEPASGAGVAVAGEPSTEAAPGGTEVAEPTGVVPSVADVGEPAAGEGAEPGAVAPPPAAAPETAVEPIAPVAETPAAPAPAPKKKVLKGSVENQVKALNVNAAVGGVPDPKVVRETLEPIDPKMARAVMFYLGVDYDGNFLVGANNLPQTPSAQKAGQMAGLGENSGDRVKKVAAALGITGDIRRKYQASQTDAVVTGRAVSEAGTGADIEPAKTSLITEQSWYEPIARKGIEQVNDTELARAAVRADRFLENRANEPTHAAIMAEVQNRAKRPEFRAAIKREFGTDSEVATVEEGTPGTEEAVDEDTDSQQTRTGPVDLENSREMDTALRGKSFTEAIDYAIKNARDDLDRHILVKARRRAEELASKGVQFSFKLTGEGRILTGGRLGAATTTFPGLGEATTVDVVLNGFTGDPGSTLAQETLVHEIVHAVTVAQIKFAPQGTAATKLRALQQELVGVYNKRFKAGTLTAIEKGVVSNALQNDRELLAYGLTNGDVQNWLASITDSTGGTFLSRMFAIVSQVLGLKGKENSALARLMSISEEIFDESIAPHVSEANKRGLSFGKQANTTGIPSWVLKEADGLKTVWYKGPIALYEAVSTTGKTIYIAAKEGIGRTSVDIRSYTGKAFTPSELTELKQAADDRTPQADSRLSAEAKATAKDLDAIGEKKESSLSQRVGRQLAGNKALRLREKFTDSLAPLEDFFVNAYGGQIRTASGRLNPMVLLSRALDALRISKAAQIEGGLSREDGLIVATELKDANGRSVSYSGVLNRIADAAKAEGKTYEDYRNTIDNILYGHREFYLRQKNREIEQQAQALDDAGKADKAKTLREGIVELYLTDEQIDRAEAAFQQDDFIKGVLSDLDTVRFNMLDMLVETSRISKEQAQDYKDNLGYVPFERIGEYENQWTQATRGANRGVAALRKLRQLEGSKRKSTSVVENFSGFMDWATKEAMKNEAARRALGDMELLGAAQRREQPPATDSPGGMVDVYEDGQKVRFYVPDPAHLVTFSLADPQLSNIIKGLSQATRLLRAGVTSMPPFAIKQIFDDVVRAYTYAGVKDNKTLVKNVLLNFPKLWLSEVRNQKTAGIRELENLGIVGTYDVTQHTNLKDVLKESGAEKEGLGSTILRVMEAGAKASDLAVRKAIYDQVLTETGDTAQAESAAREIINFSRRGSSRMMNMMISIIPFFNAYAQGMDKLASAAAGGLVGKKTGTARSMFYKRMMVLTAMGTAYALLMSDDEEYEKLPDHVRDTNWVLPYGKALGFTPAIPIPAELAFFFKAIPERVLRYYKYQGTEDERAAIDVLKELTKRGVDVFSSPNLMAQGIRPLVENLINYSFFLGRPLESQSQLALRPFERYGTGTSESMKAVGSLLEDAANATGMEAFAISPIKLENALRGLFGTSMGLALSVSDALLYPNRTDRPLHQQIGSQITGVSAVMKDPVGTRFMDEIYDLEKRTAQVYGTYNRMLKTKPEEAEAFLLDNIGMYSIRPQVQSLMETIRVMNESTQAINRDTSLSPEERRKLIDDLRAEQNDIARQVWQLRREARNIQLGLAAPSS